MECWNIGILEYWVLNPSIHHSTIPILVRCSEAIGGSTTLTTNGLYKPTSTSELSILSNVEGLAVHPEQRRRMRFFSGLLGPWLIRDRVHEVVRS